MQEGPSSGSTVIAVREQVSTGLDDEVIVLGTRTGRYYGLDEVGALIWALIQEPRTIGEIRNAVVEAYDVDGEQAEKDILALIGDLRRENLVEIVDESAAGPISPADTG